MFTENQKKVINSKEGFVYVQAPPGTGKSSTIFGCLKKDERKSLVLCFNSSIRIELTEKAKDKGVVNATFHTFHSLAFDFFKRSNVIKGFNERKMINNFDYFEIKSLLKTMGKNIVNPDKIREIKDEFIRFLASKEKVSALEEYNDGDLLKEIFVFLKENEDCFIFHAFYIKVFQLINYSNEEYKVVYCDESQDASACYNSIILNLKADKFLFFGDNQQKIYSFNGAEGMDKQNYFLDVSFRLGDECSYLCNKLISVSLGTDEFDFKGVNTKQTIVNHFNQFDKITVICRKNATIIEHIESVKKEGKFCYIIGGKESLGMDRLKNILKDFSKDRIHIYKGEELSSCNDLVALAKKTKESSLVSMSSLITKFGLNNFQKIESLERVIVDDKDMADIILTTVHKSKGLEFENVAIANDFKTVEEIMKSKDETYVFYVALSRCYGKLMINENTNEWLASLKEKSEKYEDDIF
ncbi:MAG: UvrD-helicase domain-containing protein [Cetobacterium sp.]